ncbi:class I SAM-dependent methyltransferase [Bailinhaonella thermotolerans]|uniref:SAM-dependent methyltransferase n=1 Tax=Bailinhaonella thermotolerans TaxID=1070861 RepID=A0A3A4APB4_9ACTN|nr:class I SAM-dependent methyltransferase [Bailinhaonella thermotolerans]RJL30399.1 SAM-dependent methyltransferase [Bailinhaonella thermotolerans]
MTEPHRATTARSWRLLRAFGKEGSDPAHFYGLLARDTAAQLASYTELKGAVLLDVGCGPGYFSEELRAAGALCVGLDADLGEMRARGAPPEGVVIGDGLRLPVLSGAVDVCFSSNVLEHVPEPWTMAAEMIRVTRPGGVIYLSFTNWLSWAGGHETRPWHYLGGRFAARRYERRTGRPPKNLYGRSLFPVSVGAALRWARGREDVEIVDALPRYHPRWAASVVSVPGLRELLTWNLLLVLRKR